MRKPLNKLEITQPFGVNPEYYGPGGHPGVDFRTKNNNPENSWWNNLNGWQPIYAVETGVCTVTYDTKGYGTHIWLETEQGARYLYAHLKNARPPKPENVIPAGPILKFKSQEGDIIGITNNTGNSTAAHLHFGCKPSGSQEFVDPMPLLERKSLGEFNLMFVNGEINQMREFVSKVDEYCENKLQLSIFNIISPIEVKQGTLTGDGAMAIIDNLNPGNTQGAFLLYPVNPTSAYEVASYYPARNLAFATVPTPAPTTILVHALLHLLRKYINFNKLGPYIEDVEYYPTNWADTASFDNPGWRFQEQFNQLKSYF